MKNHSYIPCSFLSALSLLAFTPAVPAATIYSSTGADAASIQTVLDQFRTDLGANNGVGPLGAGGTPGVGRREINWDGVPDAFASPQSFPGNFFNLAAGSPAGRVRGALFQSTGTFEVSANAASGTPTLFGNRNPENAADFAAFSAQRIFGLNGTNEMDVHFRIPGEPDTVAGVRGFGAVFTDVEVDGLTTLDFFGLDGALLESVDVPAFPIPVGAGDSFKSFSFLGVTFDSAVVGRVHITNGDTDLSVGPNARDAVAMDDFIYGEPKLAPSRVPEPGHGVFLFGGVVGLLGWTRRRFSQHQPARNNA